MNGALRCLNARKCLWHYIDLPLSSSLSVEQERDLLQPRPYWKEFRFDLTPLPQGETVTAAEFRIYKTLTMGQRANRSLHISVYEIQRENKHRFLPLDHLVISLSLSHLYDQLCFFRIKKNERDPIGDFL